MIFYLIHRYALKIMPPCRVYAWNDNAHNGSSSSARSRCSNAEFRNYNSTFGLEIDQPEQFTVPVPTNINDGSVGTRI